VAGRGVHRLCETGSLVYSSRLATNPIIIQSASTIGSRNVHEITVPDFDQVMRKGDEPALQGRTMGYLMLGTAGFGMASGARNMVANFLDTMNPSSNVTALANIEVNLSRIPEGSTIKLKWRGKPLFVRHRTEDEIQAALSVDERELRDPQSDEQRRAAHKPEWLILIGVCTHLGCVPLANEGNYGGWFCPCHESHYDTSGRIRQGPAPRNLEVPPYSFLDENTVLVGEKSVDV